MTFLKKLGQILLKGTQIALGISPVLQQAFPQAAGVITQVESELGQLGEVIVTVEAMGQALQIKGPEKLRAAAPLVAQVILKSGLMVNRKIHDEALFLQGSTKVADGLADILNALQDHVETEDKAA